MATFTVTNTNSGGNGSLRQALRDAAQFAGIDTITFDASLAGQTIDLRRELEIADTEGVIIDGDLDNDGIADITLDVSAFNANAPTNQDKIRIFDIDDGDNAVDSEVTLEGLTITGGEINDNGGGIYSLENLTINSSTITGNSTRGGNNPGGAIYTKEASLTINSSTISGNFTRGDYGEGGGIYAGNSVVEINNSVIAENYTLSYESDGGGAHFNNSIVTINGSTISENQTLVDVSQDDYADGGGLNFNESTGTINGSTISGNSTAGERSDGGGIAVDESALTINNSVISDNSTDGGYSDGGGIFVDDGSVTLVSSTVSGNFTGDDNSPGGGISAAISDASVILRGTTVSGNFTVGDDSNGGGIAADELEAFNSTIDGNFTSGEDSDGGGIYIDDSVASLVNSTLTSNFTIGTDSDGGGIFASGDTVRIRSSIVAGNSARAADGDEINATNSSSVTITNSLLGNNSKTNAAAFEGFTPPLTNGNITATSDGTNPTALSGIVAPLANNGGTTQTRALAANSPALDAGSNTTGLGADQRGFDRTAGGGTDIGAFEEQRVQSTINTPDNVSVPENQLVALDVNASDNNGLTFTITGGDDANLFNIDPGTGLLTFATAPNFENPNDDDNNNVYDVQVTVVNADGLSDVQDIAINVTDINEAPIATDDVGVTTANSSTTINVVANDFDDDFDPLSVSNLGSATNGTVQVDNSGNVVYMPNAGFTGLDTFSYTVTDGTLSDTGTVTISVAGGGTAPAPFIKGQPATAFVNSANVVIGAAAEAGQVYNGAITSNTDSTIAANDAILGTQGDDNLFGGMLGADIIFGLDGDDIIGYGNGDACIEAGDGDDLVYGVSTTIGGNNDIDLGSGNDNFYAFVGNNTVTGTGNNVISVGDGNDTVTTGSGNDFIYSLNGGSSNGGNDTVSLGEGNNIVFVEQGNYDITTGSGDDIIGLGTGFDEVRAGGGDNIIYMIDENNANDGPKDVLTGSGDDYVATGSGNDRIDAGSGLNTLFGDGGADTFVLRRGAYNFLGDFELNMDQIDLVGGLNASDLSVFQGNGATANDVFIFAGSDAIGQVANTTVNTFEAQVSYV